MLIFPYKKAIYAFSAGIRTLTYFYHKQWCSVNSTSPGLVDFLHSVLTAKESYEGFDVYIYIIYIYIYAPFSETKVSLEITQAFLIPVYCIYG